MRLHNVHRGLSLACVCASNGVYILSKLFKGLGMAWHTFLTHALFYHCGALIQIVNDIKHKVSRSLSHAVCEFGWQADFYSVHKTFVIYLWVTATFMGCCGCFQKKRKKI